MILIALHRYELKKRKKCNQYLIIIFKNISDPRSIRNQRHPLMTLIATSLLSVLSGIDSFSGMQDFTEMHMEKLSEYFEFPNGVPSHDTYQRLWDGIHPSEFEKSFELFTSSIAKTFWKSD